MFISKINKLLLYKLKLTKKDKHFEKYNKIFLKKKILIYLFALRLYSENKPICYFLDSMRCQNKYCI